MAINLTFYGDESGHSKEPSLNYMGMAGFVAPLEAWKELEKEWTDALSAYGFDSFHMVDFAHSRGQFAQWKEPIHESQRRALLGKLVAAIIAAKPIPVGAVIDLADFASLTPSQQSQFRDPYYVGFQTCVRGAAITGLLHDYPNVPSTPEKVAMVFAFQGEFGSDGGSAEQLWHAIKETTDFGSAMASYGSAKSTETPSLQAADLFAYELCREFENIVKTPERPMRWALKQILRNLVHPDASMIAMLDRGELLRRIKGSDFPDQTGVEQVSESQMHDAMNAISTWMLRRAGGY